MTEKKAYQPPTSHLLHLHFEGMLAASDRITVDTGINVDDSDKSAAREFGTSTPNWGDTGSDEE